MRYFMTSSHKYVFIVKYGLLTILIRIILYNIENHSY